MPNAQETVFFIPADKTLKFTKYDRQKGHAYNIVIAKVQADGSRVSTFFYVYPDLKGMISGNYFDCELSFPSASNKDVIITYTIFIEGVPNLARAETSVWKNYFKKVLVSIKPL